MAKLFNRAKMTTSTTGSGTVTLGSASVGFQSFADAGVSDGDVVQYVIEEGGDFEIGTGTYSATGTSLTRSPTESSNSDAAISLSGTATVSITAVADDLNRLQHEGSTKVEPSATGATVTGNLAVTGTVDGRDVATDGTKLDGIEANADVTDTANVTAAGALMDSEVANLAQVKAFDSSDYATAAQGTTADAALPKSGGTMTGAITFASGQTFDGRDVSADGSKLDGIEANATADQTASEILTAIKTVDGSGSGLDADTLDGSHASAFLTGNQTITLSGDASGSGTTSISVSLAANSVGASEIAANAVGASELNVSGNGTSSQFLRSDGDGTFTWATPTDTNTTYSAGSGLSLSGTTFSHTDTSSQSSVNNSGGTVIQDITLDTYGHVTGLTSYNLDGRYYTETEADTRFLRGNASDTMSGNLTVDNGTSSSILVQSDDGGTSGIYLRGNSQGTGFVEVGQSSTYGGGMYYNGDGSPAFASGEASDTIGFYRMSNGTRTEVFSYPYSSNTVTFNGSIAVGGTVDGRDVAADGTKLDGIESGATADMTASEILTAIKTVDGSGSGLDADTVDGYGTSAGQSANTVVVRSSSGYIYTSYYNGTGTFSTTAAGGSMGMFTGTNGADTFGRSYSAAQARTLLNVENGATADQTITAGGGLTGGGTGDVTISHADTSSQASVNNSGRTYIQDITLDTYGHITGITSATETVTNTDTTYSAGTGMSLSGTTFSIGQEVGTGNSPTFANMYLGDYLYHNADLDTRLQFGTNTITLTTGGSSEVTVNSTGVRLGDTGNGYFQPVSGNYGSVQIDGGAHSSWEGYSIGGRAVFMHNNSTTTGLYNDVDNEWLVNCTHNGSVYLYYNGASKLATSSTGVSVTGTVAATSFTGDGSGLTGISAGGATGGGSDEIFWENGQNVTSNYTITNNKNALSAGPITVNNGVTVTVGDGETWTVV
jgi:hypothetical protein